MERPVAKIFAQELIATSEKLDQALRAATEGTDEWSEFARPIGEILGAIYCDVLVPVYRKHPGLEREIETELGNPYL